MQRLAVLSLATLAACYGGPSMDAPADPHTCLAPAELRSDDQVDPQGLDSARARLAWQLRQRHDAPAEELRQTAYQVIAASSRERAEALRPDLWDSGVVESGFSGPVVYAGPPPPPGDMVFWRVRVRDGAQRWSAFGPVAHWLQGPRSTDDWPGAWIGSDQPVAGEWTEPWLWHPEALVGLPPPGTRFFRRVVTLAALEPDDAAELFAQVDDQAVVWVNGREVLRGGSWETALRADVRRFLRPGPNAIAVAASNRGLQPNGAGLSLRLELRRDEQVTIACDSAPDAWRTHAIAAAGWRDVDFDERGWASAVAVEPQAAWQAAIAAARRPPDPRLRKTFELPAAPQRAVLHVASIGYHAVAVNGVRLDHGDLQPHVSHLGQRARFVSHDLTGLLRAGRNAVGIELGRGWAQFAAYGHGGRALARVRLDLVAADGTRQVLASDDSWRWEPGAHTLLGGWRFRDYGGERVDAARDTAEFSDPGSDDRGWRAVSVFAPTVAISANGCAPNRGEIELPARSIATTEAGAQRIDFGRAATGRAIVSLQGEPGATVRLSMAERTTETATYQQVSEVLLDRDGRGEFAHRFNYAAGRWLTVHGAKPLRASDARLLAVAPALPLTTHFACSDERLNAVLATAVWTLRNLTLGGYLVDCPHRERFGYGGDAHGTAPALLAHFDSKALLTKWLQDWRDVQREDGSLPHTAPTLEGGGGPAWGGIGAMLAWTLYVETGDLEVLRDNYPMIQRYVAWLDTHVADEILQPHGDPEWGFAGDWVPPGYGQGPSERVPAEWTLFFNNCYRLDLLTTAARIAHALGAFADAESYRATAMRARARVERRFVASADGMWASARQPYLALALRVGLADAKREETRARLVAAIAAQSGHIDAGIHGTHYVLEQLTALDRDDLAAAIVRQPDYPGWGHMLAQGATTLWEQWDGDNSHLHASFVSVAAWFVRGLAGIRSDPAYPGYEQFVIAPTLGDLDWLTCTHECVRGTIECRWRREAGNLVLTVQVPPGTKARLRVPTSAPQGIEVDGARVEPGTTEGVRPTVMLSAGRHLVRAPL
jgi:alpha-L-rhamnosidase